MNLRQMIDGGHSCLMQLQAYGTSEGATKAWDTRGRGRKLVEQSQKKAGAGSIKQLEDASSKLYDKIISDPKVKSGQALMENHPLWNEMKRVGDQATALKDAHTDPSRGFSPKETKKLVSNLLQSARSHIQNAKGSSAKELGWAHQEVAGMKKMARLIQQGKLKSAAKIWNNPPGNLDYSEVVGGGLHIDKFSRYAEKHGG